MKYRSRKTVDAVQWWKDGDQPGLARCVHRYGDFYEIRFDYRLWDLHLGDWIITHADGTHEVVKAADFEREYERIEE